MFSVMIRILGFVTFSQAVVLKGVIPRYKLVSKSRPCFVPTLENGIVETEEITREHFHGNLSCHPGFQLVGSAQVECQAGRWSVTSRNSPFCAAITSCAEELPPTPHGHWTPVLGYGKSVYRFGCSSGYSLYGPTTVFCTKSGWSSVGGHLPVCTKRGCNSTHLLEHGVEHGVEHDGSGVQHGGAGVEHGGARQVREGAVYRFYCSKKAVMEGPPVVHCDGKSWSSPKPRCLTGPSPPAVTILIDGEKAATNMVTAGQEIVIECVATGGNPTPDVTINVDDKVGDTNIGTTKHTLTVGEDQPHLTISCRGENKVSIAHSDLHSLLLSYNSPLVEIEGEGEIVRATVAEYSCTSGYSFPQPDVTVQVTDENGDPVEMTYHHVEYQKGVTGVSTKVHFSFQVSDNVREVGLHCKSINPAGESETSVRVAVLFATSLVTISGNTSLVPEAVPEYSCTAEESNPRARMSWIVKDEDGEDVLYTNIDTPEDEDNIATMTVQTSTATGKLFITCLAANRLGQSNQTITVTLEKPPASLAMTCPHSVQAGHTAECVCGVPGLSSPQADVTWRVSDVQGEVIHPERDDYDDGHTLTSKIRFLAIARHQQVSIRCTAANTHGSVDQEQSTVIEYQPAKLVLNVPKTVNPAEEIYVDCSTDAAFPASTLSWLINGEKIAEGLDESEIALENGGIMSHSTINVTSAGNGEIVVTCCVEGMDLCSSKTARVSETPSLVQLEPAEKDDFEISYTANKMKRNESDEVDTQNEETIPKGVKESPETAAVDRIEYNAKYVKETIDFENTAFKLVSSASENALNTFQIILLLSCLKFVFLY